LEEDQLGKGQDQNPFEGAATALIKVLARLRDRHADMTLQQAMFLFYVAQRPGITQREVYEALGSSDSVASRTLAILSDVGLRNVAGLELVEMKVNPQDRRERFLSLSPKGKRLMDDILSDLARMK
jgi:DNA-binding MarR family transcriptional regulator